MHDNGNATQTYIEYLSLMYDLELFKIVIYMSIFLDIYSF
jgi:hypothetical protein